MKNCTEKNKKALIILDSFNFLSYNQKREILARYASPEIMFENVDFAYELLDKWGKGSKKDPFKYGMTKQYFDFLANFYKNLEIVTYLDEEYPQRLFDLENYPLALYCYGNLALLNAPETIAIAGSRKTLSPYLAFAKEVAKTVSEKAVIVLGNSEGVECCAMDSVENGNVICVLAGGFDKIYPQTSYNSVRRIAKNGLVISEYPPADSVKSYSFEQRNRIIAGLADTLFVVSGSFKSGVKSICENALNLGKDVCCLPYNITEESGRLCNDLIKNGAYLVTDIQDFKTKYGIYENKKEKEFTPLTQKVYDLISDGVNSVDKIIEVSHMKSEELLTALVLLELQGAIIKTGADEYSPTHF